MVYGIWYMVYGIWYSDYFNLIIKCEWYNFHLEKIDFFAVMLYVLQLVSSLYLYNSITL